MLCLGEERGWLWENQKVQVWLLSIFFWLLFPSFCLSAAPHLSVLKKSRRETSCNVCLFSLLKFSLGQHPSLRTPGAGLILRPQRRAPSPPGRTQVGWLPQVSPSPAPGSSCPGMMVLVWHFFVSAMPGDLGGAYLTPCLYHWVSKFWRFGEPPHLLHVSWSYRQSRPSKA